jgi:hypothetical protein
MKYCMDVCAYGKSLATEACVFGKLDYHSTFKRGGGRVSLGCCYVAGAA